ncbi:HPr kinase/phosphatase C-terminal domain-containing protein [Hoeflea sp. G2-23]|uniref:HPr kinase/phosphatase C-terminal domain-containing protein n=1 Tax=Hoeflea algicola TaxID=2983763 RepID=A0ABT3ZCQ9_9HYPH|nr:HPr kinase/phosphatase C-terminal domain-containing protein [Hoeflea algicola]MCY0149089.1 HPr kinase/phosphatase C-terminal domain-containing protein [Hoeflea algicola]
MRDARDGVSETVHATAIVVAHTGLLFVGSSGAGKSGMAFACLQAALRRGWNAALIADDRTCLTVAGGRLIASCPKPISGLLEIRGSGIVRLRQRDQAVMHLAVAPGEASAATRLPPDDETFACNGVSTPLLRLWRDGAADPLSMLCALQPALFLAFDPPAG